MVYETLLAGLRNQIDAQVELVKALTDACQLANKHKGSGLDALIEPVAVEALAELAQENAKLKDQMAFYDEVVRKRDIEQAKAGK
jgi:hypothetical protein